MYNETSDVTYQNAAVECLSRALDYWKSYVKIYSSMYKSELLARIGFMDVESLTEFVEKDIKIARNWKVRPL
jgi:hypothetical protein